MATITSLGVGSGLDLNGLLTQLQASERQKLTPLTQQQNTQQTKNIGVRSPAVGNGSSARVDYCVERCFHV